MYPSFCLGTPGVIAATPSGIPRATALLRDAVARGDHASALRLHEAILRFWNATDHYNLPACIRYAQSLQGVDAGFPRMPTCPVTETQKTKIKPALKAILKLTEESRGPIWIATHVPPRWHFLHRRVPRVGAGLASGVLDEGPGIHLCRARHGRVGVHVSCGIHPMGGFELKSAISPLVQVILLAIRN